jgi:hypothetical protein
MTNKVSLASLAALSIDELRDLNKDVVELIRQKQRALQREHGNKIAIGDLVKFTSTKRRTYGVHYVRVMGFNRAGTAVVGPECDKNGVELRPELRWTVANTMCTKVA